MENLTDYSFFVTTSYAIAGAALALLLLFAVCKYFSLKSKVKNGK